MADSNLQSLLSAKAALQLDLISQADFDSIKSAFLKAQQLKAAVDAGLIKAEDVEGIKHQYVESVLGAGAAPTAAAPAAAAAAPAAAAAAPAAQPHRSSSTPALQANTAPKAAAAAAPAAEPPVQQPTAAAAPQPVAPNGSGSGSAPVPTNIPKMGGAKSRSGGTSMSGISVTDDAVNLFYLMKAKSTYRWALWRVDNFGNSVVIDAVGDKDSTYGDFLGALPDSDCRYGVFDYRYTSADGQVLNKLVFFNWAPDSARVKSKMMYASTKDFFKSHLDGISAEFQASDLDEVTEDEVGSAVKALKRS